MKLRVALGVMLVGLGLWACGGAGKPPLQPDSDNAPGLGDGGPDLASSAQPAAAKK